MRAFVKHTLGRIELSANFSGGEPGRLDRVMDPILRYYALHELMMQAEHDLDDPTWESLADVRRIRREIERRVENDLRVPA